MENENLEDKIIRLRSELKADRLDMSFGELMNIYEPGDLIISPEYQRAFRWDEDQKTRFIESIFLGIPIPPIFVAEGNDGKWELIDGLQRVSTIFSFFGILKNSNKNNFNLEDSSLIGNILKGKNKDNISNKLLLSIKRSVCRIEILRWDSGFDMRYELFNRLNTGGSPLSEQEIRNCVFISKFNKLINNLSTHLAPLIKGMDKRKEKMYVEELVLRYFAITEKYNDWKIQSNIQVYLTSFTKSMLVKEKKNDNYNYQIEKDNFIKVVSFISKLNNPFKGKQKFSPSNYDTVMYLSYLYVVESNKHEITHFKNKIQRVLNNTEYKKLAGHGTSNTKRFVEKLNKSKKIFNDE